MFCIIKVCTLHSLKSVYLFGAIDISNDGQQLTFKKLLITTSYMYILDILSKKTNLIILLLPYYYLITNQIILSGCGLTTYNKDLMMMMMMMMMILYIAFIHHEGRQYEKQKHTMEIYIKHTN